MMSAAAVRPNVLNKGRKANQPIKVEKVEADGCPDILRGSEVEGCPLASIRDVGEQEARREVAEIPDDEQGKNRGEPTVRGYGSVPGLSNDQDDAGDGETGETAKDRYEPTRDSRRIEGRVGSDGVSQAGKPQNHRDRNARANQVAHDGEHLSTLIVRVGADASRHPNLRPADANRRFS